MDFVPIRLHIELLPEGVYLATSPDVPQLIAQGDTVDETIEIAQDVIRMIVDTCRENGYPVPSALIKQPSDEHKQIDLIIPISLPVGVT